MNDTPKSEKAPAERAQPVRPEGGEGGEADTEYVYEMTEAGSYTAGIAANRPLPVVPPTNIAAEIGQSRALRRAVDGFESDLRQAPNPAGFGESRTHYDSFILRNLSVFKGDYNENSISGWIYKIDLLRGITNVGDGELLRLLPLRLETRAIHFLQTLLDRLRPADPKLGTR